MINKICTKCLTEQDISNFPKHKKYRGGHSTWCRKCLSVQSTNWAKNNREKARIIEQKTRAKHPFTRVNAKFKARYGITLAEYEKMSIRQQDKCLICDKHKSANKNGKLFVDHCHSTMKVRGLLCDDCNKGIGLFRDDPSLMLKAMEYLKSNG